MGVLKTGDVALVRQDGRHHVGRVCSVADVGGVTHALVVYREGDGWHRCRFPLDRLGSLTLPLLDWSGQAPGWQPGTAGAGEMPPAGVLDDVETMWADARSRAAARQTPAAAAAGGPVG
jgi:hypothetical protein